LEKEQRKRELTEWKVKLDEASQREEKSKSDVSALSKKLEAAQHMARMLEKDNIDLKVEIQLLIPCMSQS